MGCGLLRCEISSQNKQPYSNMKKYLLLSIISFCCLQLFSQNGLEAIIVETYYISDANDATDTTGGGIEIGTKTYRIYLDLVPGTIVKRIYGDQNHPLIFSSSQNFFGLTLKLWL